MRKIMIQTDLGVMIKTRD